MKNLTGLLRKPLTIIFLLLSLTAIGGGIYLFNSPPPPTITIVKPKTITHSSPVVKEALATPVTSATPVTLAVSVTKPPAKKVAMPPQFRWQANARQTYSYQSQVELKIDIGATLQAESAWQKINSQLSGIFNARIFDTQKDRVRMGFQLSNVNFNMNGQTFPPFTAVFGTFFLVEMSPAGKPLHFHFPRYINVTNQRFIKEILNSVQVVLSPDTTKKTWKTQETHNTGYYQAEYKRQPNHEIHKYKKDYLNITLQQANNDNFAQFNLNDRIENSKFTARLATQQSWLQDFEGKERIDFNMPTGKLVEMASHIQLTLSNYSQDSNLAIWQAANDFEKVLQAFAKATGDPSMSQDVLKILELEKLRSQYANTNLTTLVNALHGIDKKNISTKDILPYVRELKQYLTAYPEAALEMPTLLDELNPSQTIAAHLIGVLERVSTPQAQQALSTIATNEEQSRAVQAIMSFNFVKDPQPEVVETLWQLADSEDSERADTGLLAIGSVLKNSTDYDQQAEVRDELVQRLQQGNEEQQATVLKAIGNSGDDSLLMEVEPYLKASEPELRRSAVQAMRHFDDPTSLEHLINAATTDEHREVRSAALQSLKGREDSVEAVTALTEYMPQETETKLRKNIIRFLGKHKNDEPQVVDSLKQQLEQEQSIQMRKELYKAIYR